MQGAQVDEVKKMVVAVCEAERRCFSRDTRLLTFMTLPYGAALVDGVPVVAGFELGALLPFVAGGTFRDGIGACVTDRMPASSCGFSICPKGVSNTLFGKLVIWLGIPLPTRNIAKSLVKLLQLCANRS